MLHEFVLQHRSDLIRRCRAKVEARSAPFPAPAELALGLPLFLDQLVAVLQNRRGAPADIDSAAARHGHDLELQGVTISQVVHAYGDVCQAITDLAVETNSPISVEEFRSLNRCLDDAIASAVTQYGIGRASSPAHPDVAHADERFGFLTHEIRNLVDTASVAFDVLRTGNVGVAGSTGDVLKRNLVALKALVGRSMDEVRLHRRVQDRQVFPVNDLLEELRPAAELEARTRDLRFAVQVAESGVAVRADRQVLAAVVVNLLQNAFKFTRPGTTVSLGAIVEGGHVRIEVADACGGLPDDQLDATQPFEQRHADRTGLGLGLAFSRWGVQANGGVLSTRNEPGHGCIFCIALPVVLSATLAPEAV